MVEFSWDHVDKIVECTDFDGNIYTGLVSMFWQGVDESDGIPKIGFEPDEITLQRYKDMCPRTILFENQIASIRIIAENDENLADR